MAPPRPPAAVCNGRSDCRDVWMACAALIRSSGRRRQLRVQIASERRYPTDPSLQHAHRVRAAKSNPARWGWLLRCRPSRSGAARAGSRGHGFGSAQPGNGPFPRRPRPRLAPSCRSALAGASAHCGRTRAHSPRQQRAHSQQRPHTRSNRRPRPLAKVRRLRESLSDARREPPDGCGARPAPAVGVCPGPPLLWSGRLCLHPSLPLSTSLPPSVSLPPSLCLPLSLGASLFLPLSVSLPPWTSPTGPQRRGMETGRLWAREGWR